jgi:hypothetical protein
MRWILTEGQLLTTARVSGIYQSRCSKLSRLVLMYECLLIFCDLDSAGVPDQDSLHDDLWLYWKHGIRGALPLVSAGLRPAHVSNDVQPASCLQFSRVDCAEDVGDLDGKAEIITGILRISMLDVEIGFGDFVVENTGEH